MKTFYLKCKVCRKDFVQRDKAITEVSDRQKGCQGGCLNLVSLNWEPTHVEKRIDGEAPKDMGITSER